MNTKNFNLIILLFISLSCFRCTTNNNEGSNTNTKIDNKFIGVWEGSGTQIGNISWTIKITLKSNEFLIEYPSLSCGGIFSLIEETDDLLLFKENINFGNNCVDQGFVELILTSAETMDYNYYFLDSNNEKGTPGATGSVTKTN